MIRRNKLFRSSVLLFILTTALFAAALTYLSLTDKLDIYKVRELRPGNLVDFYETEEFADETAPAGIRHIYRWIMDATATNENCLCIYSVHQAVDVYFDDELMYSLSPGANNRIAQSINSQWITIPVYPSDSGRQVSVIATPLLDSVIDYGIEFWHGSHFSIFFNQLANDLLPLLLVSFCIFLGIIIIIVQIYFSLAAKTKSWDMLFLGSFAIFLGLWRITFAKSSPFLFPQIPVLSGYLSIGALFLCSIPLILYTATFVKRKKGLLILSIVCSATSLIVLFLQTAGIADFRETLFLCHIMLISTFSSILVTLLAQRKHASSIKKEIRYLSVIGVGIILDLICFYQNQLSSDTVFTILAFLFFSVIMFVSSIIDTTHKAFTDAHTGLANKYRWNELIVKYESSQTPYGVIMIDLNGLKKVNDSKGHEAGDRLLFTFSSILRNTFPASSLICRWGGDEFTVLLNGRPSEQTSCLLDTLRSAIREYNAQSDDIPLHFAAGYAISSEHPGKSGSELLQIADRMMYEDKKAWYEHSAAL